MLQLTWIILGIAAVKASKIPQTDAETTAPTTTTTTTTISTAAAQTTIDNVIGTTAEAFPPASCEGLENGTHALGACSAKYFSCWYGKTFSFRCMDGLVFSETRGECVFKYRIPECNDTFVPNFRAVSNSPPVVDFCNGKTNGWYGDGCNPYFYICDGPINEWNKFTNVLYCPYRLFYDAENRQCEFKEKIVACGAKPKKTTTTTTTDVTSPSSSDNNYCQEKPNGFFGTACNNYFYYCSDGSTFRLPCPRGHHFDDDKKRCAKKEVITACGATTATTTASVGVSCVGKPKGYYSAGCSVSYYSCAGNVLTLRSCGSGHLRFDVTRNLCDHPDKVQECGGSLTTAPSNPNPTPTADFTSGVANPAPVQEATFNCSGKADGFYVISTCSKFYARCFSNTGYIQQCPAHLAFNHEKELCDYKEKIPACPEAKPTATTTVPTLKKLFLF